MEKEKPRIELELA